MGQSGSSGNGLCLTPACVNAASYVVQNLAPNWESLDPCTNFYEMACGGVLERWDDSTRAGEFMQARVNRILRKVIEAPYEEAIGYHSILVRNNVDEANHVMLQRDYQSCMDTEAILAAGATPLIDVLVELAKVWPFNPDDTTTIDTSEYQDLNQAILHLEKLGVSSFRAIEGTPGVAIPFVSDPDVIFPAITPPTATHKNTSVYGDPDALEAYAAQVAKIFSGGLYPINISESQAQIIAQGVVFFETRLAIALEIATAEWQAQVNPEDQGAQLVNMSFDDLASLAPALGLDKIVSFFVPPDYKSQQVVLSTPGFFANASAIIEATSKTALQSWLAWRTIVSLADDVLDSFTQTTVHTAIGTGPRRGRRWEQCLQHTETSLVWIMDRYFVSASYTDGMKDLVTKITVNVQSALVKRFSELDWMTDGVKARAIDKANKMQHNIGFPTQTPNLQSPNSLADYYQGLEITDNYFSNVLAARLNNLKTEYATVGKPYDRTRFSSPAHEVNAGYLPLANSITINAAVSQPFLFHPDLPSYAVYGDMGANTIGHEITHGFDSEGHKWDERGATKAWFDNATNAGFEARAKCFVDEYGKYEVPIAGGKMGKVDGEKTLGENLSDVGGLRLAFEAWKALGGGEKNSQNLPGLENFTHEQLFYLFWANGYCGAPNPDLTPEALLGDVHSPDMIRIVGGADNSRGFKEAWGCKVKEPKCELF